MEGKVTYFRCKNQILGVKKLDNKLKEIVLSEKRQWKNKECILELIMICSKQ
jgi:hypothetical protein